MNLCLEHLNTRDNTHPMKGHPGYFGDNVDLCIDLIKRVDSPRMKLLFDIYHVQIMHGDVIRHIRQYKRLYRPHPHRGRAWPWRDRRYAGVELPGHHAGLAGGGLPGLRGHEVIPTWSDPLASLRHAVRVCDVWNGPPAIAAEGGTKVPSGVVFGRAWTGPRGPEDSAAHPDGLSRTPGQAAFKYRIRHECFETAATHP